MRLLPLALGVLWPAIAIAGASEEELASPTQVDESEDILIARIIHTPRLPAAGDAVFELLGRLLEDGRISELHEWVERLADDPVITFRRPELAGRLREMQIQFAREDADELERAARKTHASADYGRCADTYASLADRLAETDVANSYWKQRQLSEMRYNAAVCAEHAGHPLTALSLYRRVAEADEALAEQASVRFVRLLGALPQIGIARLTGAPISTVELPRHEYNFPDDIIEF
ncbi:MAG: hypothetical protein HOV81_11750 [Kofleriaceae bacterium]|nr:hypothetical protein [Kofleriaceae bacterium]